jgi:hypothetical protein
MAWRLEGRYFENCSCDAVCPCTWSNLTRRATRDYCRAVLAFRVDAGEIEGLDVSGRIVVLVAEAPAMMVEGGWKLGTVVDDGASAEQTAALGKVFSGEQGGPLAALAPLIAGSLGSETASITVVDDHDNWSLRIGEATEFAGTPVGVPDSDDHVTLTGIVVHPAGPVLTITPVASSRVSLLGVEFEGQELSGFTAPFTWAA